MCSWPAPIALRHIASKHSRAGPPSARQIKIQKGFRVGGAHISEKHANFFVNEGEATAEDIRALIAEAWNSVREQFGVELELEVELVGDWDFE